ncbi:MAG: nitronate monooxygenase [Hyphomicrobium sp.]|nr:nitronate monooxygenase [Hyphomicrobium sp.]
MPKTNREPGFGGSARVQRLLSKLGVTVPIVQAPMSGASTPRLVAAVSNLGGLGSLGCAALTPSQVRAHLMKHAL